VIAAPPSGEVGTGAGERTHFRAVPSADGDDGAVSARSARDAAATGEGRRTGSLRAGSIGLAGVVFLVIATIAPMSGTIGALPLAFGLGTGAGTPGAFVVVAVVLLLFAVGYTAMSRHMATAGGFYVYIGEGLGLRAARAAGYLALLAYNVFQVAIWGTFGFFFNAFTAEWFGWDVSWIIWVLLGIGLVGVLGYFEIDLSAKVLGVAVVLEVLAILVMAFAIVFSGGADGLTLEPFTPGAVTGDNLGIGLMFCFLLFIGFEATAIYGEEARDPRRTIPRAAIVAVVLIAAFYIFVSWSLTMAYGFGAAHDSAAKDLGGFVFGAGREYVGPAQVTIMEVLFLVSTFATVQGFHNAISRYGFSLARDGWAPAALGRTHPRHDSPFVSSFLQTAIAAVVVLVFFIAGKDPYAEMFTWLIALGGVGLMVLMASTSIAAIAFFRRRRVETGAWTTVVAPVLAAVGLVVAVVLLIVNWDVQTAGAGGLIPYLPWLLLVPVLIGALWPAGRRPESWSVR
jgi:amino acid transporter